jgi:hypothetical protein
MGWILWTIFWVIVIDIVFAAIRFIVVPVVIFIISAGVFIFYWLVTGIYWVLKDGFKSLNRSSVILQNDGAGRK